MMNRLWVRLSIIFALVIIVGFLMLGLTTAFIINDGVPHDMIAAGLQAPGGLADNLSTYFAAHGSWADVADLLEEFDLVLPRGLGGPRVILVFADQQGTILYSGLGSTLDLATSLAPDDLANAIPVRLNGRIIGYLYLEERALQQADVSIAPRFPLANWSNGLILIIIFGALVSVIAGALASRQLTAPLNQLARTARSFSSRNMSIRAAVNGSIEIRSVAQAFNDMADELEGAERLRRSLLADVAHELRTPLSVLQANLQAILDDVYPLNKDEIQALNDQVDLLRRLVNDLHLLAQAEAKQLPLNLHPVELNGLTRRALDKFDALSVAHHINLQADLAPQPIIVEGDTDRLTQVLNNLLQNALTHTPDFGAITLDLSQSDGRAWIRVQDTGSGIPAEAQAHIFDRFYRVDAARDRASGGAGLGLAIVKAIVEMHHGQVSISSDGIPGHGSLFIVSLPLLASPAEPLLPA